MSARLTNIPSYAVQDWTFFANLSVGTARTGAGTHPLVETITGVIENVRDKDLTTSYKSEVTGGGGGGSNDYATWVILDFGKVLWNCILYTKYDLGNGTHTIDTSPDGTNWTDISGGVQNATATFGIFSTRYVRFYAKRTDAVTYVEVFEARLMGS